MGYAACIRLDDEALGRKYSKTRFEDTVDGLVIERPVRGIRPSSERLRRPDLPKPTCGYNRAPICLYGVLPQEPFFPAGTVLIDLERVDANLRLKEGGRIYASRKRDSRQSNFGTRRKELVSDGFGREQGREFRQWETQMIEGQHGEGRGRRETGTEISRKTIANEDGDLNIHPSRLLSLIWHSTLTLRKDGQQLIGRELYPRPLFNRPRFPCRRHRYIEGVWLEWKI